MSRCLVLGAPAQDGGGRAANIAHALERLGVDVALLAGAPGGATPPGLDDAAAGCELLVLVAEAAGEAMTAAAGWIDGRRAAATDAPRLLVMLVPAGGGEIPGALWSVADVAVCGRSEAAAVTGLDVDDPLDAEDAAVALLGLGPSVAVVTLGAEGAVVARAGRATYLPPFTVEVVDPAGAGDVFCAALGLGMLEGLDNFAATGYAMAAAAVSIGRPGSAESMPSRDDVERMAHSVDLRHDPGTLPVEFPR